jgi:hypothetical protein
MSELLCSQGAQVLKFVFNVEIVDCVTDGRRKRQTGWLAVKRLNKFIR